MKEFLEIKELKFKGFKLTLVYDNANKDSFRIAKIIITESLKYKEQIEDFINSIGIKEKHFNLFAYSKEKALKEGLLKRKKSPSLIGITLFHKNNEFQKRIIIALSLKEFIKHSGLSIKNKIDSLVFYVFLHELLHAICGIRNERKIDKILKEFLKTIKIIVLDFF